MSDLMAKLRDVNTTESRIAQSVATGAFTTLVSPGRLSSRTVVTMHVLSGALGGVGGAVLGQKFPPVQRAAVGVAAGGLFAGMSVVGVVADVKAEEWLRKRGVRRPRVVMGVVAGILTWLTSKPTESLDSLDQSPVEPGEPRDPSAAGEGISSP